MPHGPARQPEGMLGSQTCPGCYTGLPGNQNAYWAATLHVTGSRTSVATSQYPCKLQTRQPDCVLGNACGAPSPAKQPECMFGSQIACHGSLMARMQIRHTIACWSTLREARWLPGPTSTKHLTSHLDKQMLLSRHAPVANSFSTSLCRCISTGTH